jgi:hypothetical protein
MESILGMPADCKEVSKQTADIYLISAGNQKTKSAGKVKKLLDYSTADSQLSANKK